ncbi:hypothetical protein [Lentibacillus sp. Marseille-P4043]|uniref:hypothetical protein n=1 Tax=Lentibacillus sp. Marseille-P4043 TaxID=2040293 RepID=UPI000D0AD0AC|nr:hypothetical protein [Lentibacillus sp. Marseille-P4043]
MMKKYWKAIAILIVIVLSIGTYYIHSIVSASQYPEFVIKKQSGDEKEIEGLNVSGSYQVGSTYENLEITADGSLYDGERSFFDRIQGTQLFIGQLRKEYRSFMRGKGFNPAAYFENEDFLAYGDVSYQISSLRPRDYDFEISILDKKSDKTTTFTLGVPNSGDINYIQVLDVQMVNDKLKVLTHNTLQDYNNSEFHVYEFNVDTNGLTDDDTIISAAGQSGTRKTYTDVSLLNETNVMNAHEYAILSKIEGEQVQLEDGTYTSKEKSNGLIAYNYKTGKKETIKLPEKIQGQEFHSFDGTSVYGVEMNQDGIVITPYNIKKQIIDEEISMQLSVSNDVKPSFEIRDGKLYALQHLTNLKTTANLVVADLKSGETLYKGEIIKKDPAAGNDEYELFLSNVVIQ